MSRTSSPNSYFTTWSNSMPRPRKVERYSPLSTFSTAWRTRHSSWRRRASGFSTFDCGFSIGISLPANHANERESPFFIRGWPCSPRGHRGLGDDLGDDLVRGNFLRLGLVGQADAVAHHLGRELLHQRGRDVILATEPGERAAGLVKRERGARRGAKVEVA